MEGNSQLGKEGREKIKYGERGKKRKEKKNKLFKFSRQMLTRTEDPKLPEIYFLKQVNAPNEFALI